MSVAKTIQPASKVSLRNYLTRGSRIVCGQACAEPLTLTHLLVNEASDEDDWSIFVGASFSTTFARDLAPRLRFQSYGAIGNTGALADKGVLDIRPIRYSRLPEHFSREDHRADLVLLQGCVDSDGSISLGLCNDYTVAAARNARSVVVEVNEQVPWTCGAELPHDIDVDLWVEADRPPQTLGSAPDDAVSAAIACHVAGVIPDGATLQIGVGAIPDATLRDLRQHRHLGFHSGVYTDAVHQLVKDGVMTNALKGMDVGVCVTNTVCGSSALYRELHRNPVVQVRPSEHTHCEQVISSLHKFHAINSALQIDLTGQANCEAIDQRLRGGIGGLIDFCRGARRSVGGRSITVLPATAKGGTQSRIVANLGGNPVTMGRTDTDLVITEFGVADLRNASLNERARRLINVAAPRFREELQRQWRNNPWGACAA